LYSWRRLREKIFIYIISIVSLLALLPIAHLIITVFLNGFNVLLEAGAGFLFKNPPVPLSREIGGIGPSLTGSFLLTVISLPVTVILGLFAAILTTEFPRNPFSLLVDTIAKSLASIPTIAVSMVVFTLVVLPMKRFSALAGATALVIVALPYTYSYFSTMLLSIPSTYREAGFSLAMSRWGVVARILIPIAKRNLMVGVLMTLARIMGETAALLFTCGRLRTGLPSSLMGPVDAIPLLIFDYILSPFEIWRRVAWGAALILLLVYMLIFFAVKFFVKEVRL